MWDADLTEEDILEWTQVDCNNPGHQQYTDEEIISQVMREDDACSEEGDDKDEESQKCISNSEAADTLEQCLGCRPGGSRKCKYSLQCSQCCL